MDILYKEVPPIEETELEFCKRKMQDRADFIAVQKDTITKLKDALYDIMEIVETVFA